MGRPLLLPTDGDRTIGVMPRKSKSTRNSKPSASKPKGILGRSALTGTRVLRPATAKGGTVTLRQVRAALRTLTADDLK